MQIVVSRSAEQTPERCDFENAVVDILASRGDVRLLVVPSVYCLDSGHPALSALRSVQGDFAIASWLHPRACFWVLRAHDIEGEPQRTAGARTITCLHLADFASAKTCAEALVEAARAGSAHEVFGGTQHMEAHAPMRWYPVIDYSLCQSCRKCYDFCLFGVYSLDNSKRVKVTSPDSCKPGCSACARTCPHGAVVFPHDPDAKVAGQTSQTSRQPCPVCGCACDCARSTDGTAPEGMTVCPACGCICDPKDLGQCQCRKSETDESSCSCDQGKCGDDLDGLIDALDELDI